MRTRSVRGTPAGVLLAVLCTASPGVSQERDHSPFGCTEGAVHVEIDRQPPFRFEALERSPQLRTGHEFIFDGSPFGLVRVYLTATLTEEEVGRESTAQLSVYVETAASPDDARSHRSQWWHLVSTLGRAASGHPTTSHGLLFDAKRIATCFAGAGSQNGCAFADVSLAASDENLPLIVLGFTQDLGGANASNWDDARLLLDFRASPPRVAVTLDCGYNEGGGACTAIDSGMMPRSAVTCDWLATTADFLCSERTSAGQGGHRDFYLLSGRVPPLRPSDIRSLEEAARMLRHTGIGARVTVARLGPVVWIDEVTVDRRTSAMLLASAGTFYLAERSKDKIGRVLAIRPHGILEAGVPAEPAGLPENEWVDDAAPRFRTQRIFRNRTLTVFQVVETDDGAGEPSALHWIGVDRRRSGWSFDALRLVGHGRYHGCGRIRVPATVASIDRITRPFQARLRVQPPTMDNIFGEGDVKWDTESDEKHSHGCMRTATLQWNNGRFEVRVDHRPCSGSEQPRRVRIAPDGRLRLEPR